MIQIDNDYFIEVSELCYTVKRRKHKVDKKGVEIVDTVGYYSTLSQALEGMIRNKIKVSLSNDENTLGSALKCVLAIRDEYMDIMRKILGDN